MAKYPVHAQGIASRRIGDEEVIVSGRAGKVWALNEAGALFWELADGSRDMSEIAGLVARCRRIEDVQVEDEINSFSEDMAERGLLAWREAPGEPGRRSRRAAESLPEKLPAPPCVVHEEELQVLAGACDSSHSGQGAACMLFGSCVSGFS